MEKAFILFNGIQYPFPVVEAAIAWAKQSGVTLTALFIHAHSAPKEGYLFPSDLDAAEEYNSTGDASSSHLAVVESNRRMLQHEADRQGVKFESKVLAEPEDDDLQNELSGAELVFAAGNIERQGVLTVDSIDWQKHLHDHPSKIVNG